MQKQILKNWSATNMLQINLSFVIYWRLFLSERVGKVAYFQPFFNFCVFFRKVFQTLFQNQ